MKDFQKYHDELLYGAKEKREYHGEAKKAYDDVVKTGTNFKRALVKLSEVQVKFKNERDD